jgi:hypothetical protein
MRKVLTVALSAVMVVALAIGAAAAGNVSLTLSSSSVTDGTPVNVTVAVTTAAVGNHIQLFACYLKADDGTNAAITTAPAAASNCPADEDDLSGTYRWLLLQQKSLKGVTLDDAHFTHTFQTTGLGDSTVGFLAIHPPVASNPEGKQTRNLTVTTVGSPAGDRHPGCNGIEKSVKNVKAGGNAESKLKEIFERFHCDENA